MKQEKIEQDKFYTVLAIGISLIGITILLFGCIQMFLEKEYGNYFFQGFLVITNAILVYRGKAPNTP